MDCVKNISCFCMKYKSGGGWIFRPHLGKFKHLNQLTWCKITENSPPSFRKQKCLSNPCPPPFNVIFFCIRTCVWIKYLKFSRSDVCHNVHWTLKLIAQTFSTWINYKSYQWYYLASYNVQTSINSILNISPSIIKIKEK